MGIEGLDLILNKQEVVPTVSASDLLHQPERVENDYLRHVHTYVPLSRSAQGRKGDLNVNEFERKVIKAVKDARAPRGYLTADYGYGKTSTALYLWQRAEAERLVVVPPFQMLHLQDLVTAIHGWVRYRLQVSNPQLIPELERFYDETTGRSLEYEAKAKGVSEATLRAWFEEGRFIVDLQPVDYVRYFENMTDLVLRAGYEGLLVLPDEIQQYIEPRMQRSDDPIAPLFNLVQMVATRDRYLRFGIIMVIPLKEIGVIREARGRDDLLHRMRELSLDLTNVYDHDFAVRLWNQLADEFDYQDISPMIVTAETLDALGEIAARNDLSNGPRTVVNTFRRMVERFKTLGMQSRPYSPIDLVDDLIGGAIQFSGNNQIQNVTRRALQNAIVRRQPERYEPAIKLAAAYPGAGVPLQVQQKYSVDEALDELMQQALGELVIAIGPIDQHGVTLFGLQVGNSQISWLPQTIRDFRRVYGEHLSITRGRAISVFILLLRQKIFPNWTIIEERHANYVTNESVILEGDFPSFASRYPKRRVHVRVLWEDEERKDADIEGDLAIEFRLSMHGDLRHSPEERRRFSQSVDILYDENIAVVPINLMYVRLEGVPLQIQQQLQDVWSPYDLSPLVLMNIYQVMEEKRAGDLIPRSDEALITNAFQPDLLDTILRDLFNAEVGASLGGVAQAHIVELIVVKLLDARYQDTYRTVMATGAWKSQLQRYRGALEKLSNLYQRRGDIEVEGTKKEIADLLTYSSSALDSFLRTLNSLITVTRDWRGNEEGSVRFILHDLEQKIIHWLRESTQTDRVSYGGRYVEVRKLPTGEVFKRAERMGYKNEEVNELIQVLVARGMVEFHQNYLLREVPSQTVDLDEAKYQVDGFIKDLELLLQGFPDDNQLKDLRAYATRFQQVIEEERKSGAPDPKKVHQLGRTVQNRHNELRNFAQDKQRALFRELNTVRQSLRPISPQRLTILDTPIMGSVGYVDQVNVLRRATLDSAQKLKVKVDNLNARLERGVLELQQEMLAYEALSRLAQQRESIAHGLHEIKGEIEVFESAFNHFANWQNLVTSGSELVNELQQMSRMATSQMNAYENLAREISGRISSAINKLNVLPDHALYANRVQGMRDEIRSIRQNAEKQFLDLQNRYYQSLTSQNLYRRDQLDRLLTFNLSTPEESYRLLYDNVQRWVRTAAQQLLKNLYQFHQNAQNIAATPLVQNLPSDQADQILEACRSIIEEVSRTITDLQVVDQKAADLDQIIDFPSNGGGKYDALVDRLVVALSTASEFDRRSRQINGMIGQIAPTPEESAALEVLPLIEQEGTVDIVEWKNHANRSSDEFWKLLRSLHEKQYIRVQVRAVRR